MTRTLLAAFLATCGMTSAASAQMYYHGPGYTSYYAPASYSSYSYTSGYGPLGIFSPRAWFGGPVAYTSPYYGSTAYTAAYTPSYTASYSPVVTTSYYAPTVVASADCCTPCCAACTPCSSCGLACASCASGNCPGGNCSLNYAPTNGALKPEPDPTVSGSSGSQGSRTFESESKGGTNNGGSGSDEPDSFEPYDRNRPSDGFNGERGAGYRPESKIEQKAPAAVETDEAEKEAAPAEADTPTGGLSAPAADDVPDARFLDLDTRITSAPSLLRDRTRMSARFGSPKIARAKVDPASIPGATELRLVKK